MHNLRVRRKRRGRVRPQNREPRNLGKVQGGDCHLKNKAVINVAPRCAPSISVAPA